MLRATLSLIHTPKELWCLGNNTLLNGCVRGLRSYSQDLQAEDRELFTYDFGFLCFRVTLLVVQVSILARANMLDDFANSQSDVSDPNKISAALSEAATQRVLDATMKDNSRERLFGAFVAENGEIRSTNLYDGGSYGGVPVEFLSRLIWRDRKEILQIFHEVKTTGWSFVFLLIKEHLRWARESEECYWPFEWAMMQMLCYRQILVTSSLSKISYLTDICIAGGNNRYQVSEPLYEDTIQDKEDIEVLMKALARRIKPSPMVPRLPVESAEPILGWFTHYLIMPTMADLVPEFFEGIYSWIWAEVTNSVVQGLSKNTKLVKFASHALYFTTKTFIAQLKNRKTKAELTEVLFKVDFVKLVGKLLLAPLEVGSTIMDLLSNRGSTHVTEVLDEWANLQVHLRNNTLMSGCMPGLRSYSQDLQAQARELFMYEFGFLCSRMTLLVVQVSILARANMLDDFANSRIGVSDPNKISAALSEAATQRVLDAAKEDNSRERLFGPYISENGEKQTTNFRWPLEWAGIQMLCYRQILVTSSPGEVAFLSDICTARENNRSKHSEPLYKDAILDEEDAKILMTAATRRIMPSPTVARLPGEIVEDVLEWLRCYPVMTTLTDLVPGFLEANYSRIWAELSENITQGLSENTRLVRYACLIISFTRVAHEKHKNSEDRAAFTKALSKVDFFNLIGKLLLALLELGGQITNPPSGKQFFVQLGLTMCS
ncbi:hypothetical protein FRC07_007697 [Ceratobasidium sp. 392]|nr:hypothetical protein FRC07_007697 [Ceratobasidium sp. 392]